jgi:hypothetical protein
MSFFTVAWQAPASIGLQPIHAGMEDAPFFTIGWTPKRMATYYPYDADALMIKPGGGADGGGTSGGGIPVTTPPNEPRVSGGGDGSAGAGGGNSAASGSDGSGSAAPIPPPTSPVLRPHVVKLSVVARKDPAAFRKGGLDLRVQVDAPATIEAVLLAGTGRRRLGYSQTRKVKAGTTKLTLRASDYGKGTSLTHKKVTAKLRVTITFADRTTRTLTKNLVIEAAAKTAKKAKKRAIA